MRLIDADKLDWWYKGRNIRRVIDDAPHRGCRAGGAVQRL